MNKKHSIPIIRTKLHRPPVAGDFVHREGLCALLDQSFDHPLTLISAPAGYGKSTSVSHWIEYRDCPYAWLTFDETDSEVRVFLSYVVAAVQTVYPEACADTQLLLTQDVLPPLPVLAGCLSNDLAALEESLVLVLDDYNQVNQPGVHELINYLLKYPPDPLQLVIITRRDPPLLLGALRAHNNLTEVRVGHLLFTRSETQAFLEQATGQTFSNAVIDHIQQITEGWVAGLRLAALALKDHSDVDAYLLGFDFNAGGVQDYLIEEVLARQQPGAADRLCKISILSRFCAPLCEAIGAASAGGDQDQLDGSGCIEWLKESGLFCVALDEHGEWYRYHQLFQELLQQQLKRRFTPDEISSLHRQAAAWFETHGLLEEAIQHFLNAGDPAAAGRLIVRHHNAILNGEQWHRLGLWFDKLPTDIVDEDPELLMLKAWHLKTRGCYAEAFQLLDCIEELVGDGPQQDTSAQILRGSVDSMRCLQKFKAGQGQLARQHAEAALMRLPTDYLSERAYAYQIQCLGMQECGDLAGARKLIHTALVDALPPLSAFQARLHGAFCFIDWIAADMRSMRVTASRYFKLSEALQLHESTTVARYFLGIAEYEYDDRPKAEQLLMSIVDHKTSANLEIFTEGTFALASVYLANGRPDQASRIIESVCEQLLTAQNMVLLQKARAYQADLALQLGDMDKAMNWAPGFDPDPLVAGKHFYEPRITLAKVLIAQGTADSLAQADLLLARLQAFYSQIHHTRCLIQVLALQALLNAAKGDDPTARDALARAVSLGLPGGSIRLFVDLGSGLVKLLNTLDLNAEEKRYVGRILDAYLCDGKTKMDEASEHPLTNRELEVLELMAKKLSNKQIANQLYIAAATVKRHSENIYQKLDAPGRHQAVIKAKGLAIIHTG
jgi:LuxR family maltose regulon positive regulatory protein